MTIDAMTPQYAAPGTTVRLSGTVTNGTRQTQAGLDVQLYTSAAHFTTRIGMDSYLSHGVASDLLPAGNPFLFAASLSPGRDRLLDRLVPGQHPGISSFGVYPVTAQLQDLAGDVFSSQQTLLPFWPASPAAAGLARPLQISWLWPLIDQPHRQACAALTSNGLAPALNSGGRLSALLNAGASHADADLTWIIDPALLGDVATMTRPYQVGGQPNCTLAPSKPALPAAASWLAGLRKVTADQPRAHPVRRRGHDRPRPPGPDRGSGHRLPHRRRGSSRRAAREGRALAWQAGGTADLSVLTNLATAEHVGTVVLNSTR